MPVMLAAAERRRGKDSQLYSFPLTTAHTGTEEMHSCVRALAPSPAELLLLLARSPRGANGVPAAPGTEYRFSQYLTTCRLLPVCKHDPIGIFKAILYRKEQTVATRKLHPVAGQLDTFQQLTRAHLAKPRKSGNLFNCLDK